MKTSCYLISETRSWSTAELPFYLVLVREIWQFWKQTIFKEQNSSNTIKLYNLCFHSKPAPFLSYTRRDPTFPSFIMTPFTMYLAIPSHACQAIPTIRMPQCHARARTSALCFDEAACVRFLKALSFLM